MEDLVQVLFFLAIIIFSMIDAFARKRKKEREMEDLDRTGDPAEQQEQQEQRQERGSLHRPEPEVARDERGSDSMIPSDLWEEITGMKRPAPQQERAPGSMSGGQEAGAPASRAPTPGEPLPGPAPSPVPAPSPTPTQWGTSQPTASAGRSKARSRDVHSAEARSTEARQDEFPDRKRTTELGALAEEIREQGRREMTDVPIPTQVEKVGEGIHPDPGAREFPGARRRRRASGVAAKLAGSLRRDPQALQKAVLYREVLGRPIGSREGPGGWEEPAG